MNTLKTAFLLTALTLALSIITGNPYALASAVQKLDAHLFIVAPLLSRASFAGLFATHPPMASRLGRLTGRPAL